LLIKGKVDSNPRYRGELRTREFGVVISVLPVHSDPSCIHEAIKDIGVFADAMPRASSVIVSWLSRATPVHRPRQSRP
ncbi:hypothetical protein, partial [Mycobacterium sp.]|uniref:hypothetical protein n=1 Tax=Mycobacterium sp. TaxID=1785 RepID=UPI002D120545